MKEPRKIRWNVLSTIEYVCEQTKCKKLKYENTAKMKNCLEKLKSYFGNFQHPLNVLVPSIPYLL